MAWARWQAGSGGMLDSGEALWGDSPETSNTTRPLCCECRVHGRCDDCPEPALLPDALPFVQAYAAVATQWNYAGMGERAGLRYDSCIATLQTYLPSWQADPAFSGLGVDALLSGLQIIERTLLDCDAEARAKRTADKPNTTTAPQRIGG